MRRGERQPGDFLVLFRTRRHMSDYARALESRGIPYELSGGGAFEDSEELRTLLPLLQAISDPDDPVSFTAVLRGPLFGVDDEALYRHARAGGRFSFRAALPEAADPRIARACALLLRGRGARGEPAARRGHLAPVRAARLDRVRRRAGARRQPRRKPAQGDRCRAHLLGARASISPRVVAELDRLTDEGYIEEMSARPGRPGAVRLLTVHGAKGLEAPVVFLADPRRESRPAAPILDRPPRRTRRGHWRVIRETEGFGVVEIAEPRGWEEMAAIEKAFDDAEKKRLLYVASTRANEMLVVSVWKQGKSENAQGPWSPLAPFLTEDLPEAGPPRRVRAGAAALGARRQSSRRSRRGASAAGGRAARRPTPSSP